MERRPPSDPPRSTAPEASAPAGAATRLTVAAYPPEARIVAFVFYAIAAGNVANLALHVASDVFQGTKSAPPLSLALTLATFSGLPLLGVSALRRLFTATLDVGPVEVVLALRRARVAVPAASIRAVRALNLPLPGPGIALVLTSGRRLRYRLVLPDPDRLVGAFVAAGIDGAETARRHPTALYVAAKRSLGPRRWYWAALKLGVMPLALSVLLFRLHQMIGYGGALGQYYLLGLASYLTAFALTCTGTTVGLWIYAAVCRAFGEAFALIATRLVPSGARAIRVVVEGMCVVAYYGLVPAYVAVALLA